MITPLPGVTTTKPGSACFAIPGVYVEVVDDDGNKVTQGGGYLTITHPSAFDVKRNLGVTRSVTLIPTGVHTKADISLVMERK